IVHGDRHKVAIVEDGVTATADAGLFLPDKAGQPWSRVPYPLVERDGYITSNTFDCSFAPDDRFLYAVTPDTGIVSIEASSHTIVSEFGRPGEFRSVCGVPGEPGRVVAASIVYAAGTRVPAHALVDLTSAQILARSRYLGPKCVYSPALRSLVVVK